MSNLIKTKFKIADITIEAKNVEYNFDPVPPVHIKPYQYREPYSVNGTIIVERTIKVEKPIEFIAVEFDTKKLKTSKEKTLSDFWKKYED